MNPPTTTSSSVPIEVALDPAWGPSSQRTIVVLVENKAGLLARVADLFAR
jgi:hypothetical protein